MTKKDLKKKVKHLRKIFRYKFDYYISRGFISQFILLFSVILAIVLIFGIIAGLVSREYNVGTAIWQALTHILDAGILGGDQISDGWFVVVMVIVTFLGMAFTGTIVGIITNALNDKINNLKKGHSQVIEKGHVVIVGFNDNIYTIINELMESNENWSANRTIVVVDDMDKEKMDYTVREHMRAQDNDNEYKSKAKAKTQLIFRSGNTASEHTYDIVSISRARAIIINKDDDFDIIRTMLALTSYLKKHGAYFDEKSSKINQNMPSIVTLMHEGENFSAAAIAAGVYHEKNDETENGNVNLMEAKNVNYDEHKVRILYFESILAHIFAQVCRQPGLSWVLTEIFDYDKSEIYIEDKMANGRSLDADFTGKTFAQVSDLLDNSIAIGIQRGTEIILNPRPYDEKFRAGDKLIHLANDDNEIALNRIENCAGMGEPAKALIPQENQYHFLIFGWSVSLSEVIENIKGYSAPGSSICVISDHYIEAEDEDRNEPDFVLKNECFDPYDWHKVKAYLEKINWDDSNPERPTNIVILCQDDIDKVKADEKAAVLLLNIRDYLKKRNRDKLVNITTEMNLPRDQALLSHATANDFIVGSEIANRMLVQVANNPFIFAVFNELLNNNGSEIYLRSFDEYVDTGKSFNFKTIQNIARDRVNLGEDTQEIALGWIRLGLNDVCPEVHLNPTRAESAKPFVPDEGYKINDYRVVTLAKG